MKVITIGRDPSCNIVINDPEISRRHAIVRVSDFGKIEIVDLSTNGTSVNGNPLRKNVPYPVTRKNQVTFAGVSKLNWDDIPDPFKMYKWIACGIAGLIVLALAIAAIAGAFSSDPEPVTISTQVTAPSGPTQTKDNEKVVETKGKSKTDKQGADNNEVDNDINRLLKRSPAPVHKKEDPQPASDKKDKPAPATPNKTKPAQSTSGSKPSGTTDKNQSGQSQGQGQGQTQPNSGRIRR